MVRILSFSFWLALTPVVLHAHQACDPDALLVPMTAEQRAIRTNLVHFESKSRAISTPQRRKSATWNLNLLNVRGWKSHFYKVNSARLGDLLISYLQTENPDDLSLQELWSDRDRRTVREVAAATGYVIIDSPQYPRRNGLMTLIRRDTIAAVEGAGFREFPRHYVFYEMIGAVRRGLLWARIRLHDGQTLLLGNTHFTAFGHNSDVRLSQSYELAENLRSLAVGADAAMIAGDLNFAADFMDRPDQPKQMRVLRSSRWLYPHFASATGLRDSFRSVEGEEPGYTYNPLFKKAVNSGYGGIERRLDYIWVGETAKMARAHVLQTERKFMDEIDGVFASDHFLVQSTIEYFQISP